MSQTDLSQYNNSWYQPGPLHKRVLWMVVSFLFFEHSLAVCNGIKRFWLRVFGAQLGVGVIIKPQVKIKYPWKLRVGNYCWIGEQVWIDNLDQVILEDHVCVSQGALLQCGNHNYKSPGFDLMVQPITLKEGSWVGAKSCVAPGVTVGVHAILTLGSVATKNLEAYKIYSGNPATYKKDRVFNEKV